MLEVFVMPCYQIPLLEVEVVRGETVVELLNELVVGHGLVDELLVLLEFLWDHVHPLLLLRQILNAVSASHTASSRST